jgi:hypothetical protein
MQLLVIENNQRVFQDQINTLMEEGWRSVSPLTLGTTSQSVGFWQAFPTGRVYLPIFSMVLDDGGKALSKGNL